MLGATIDGTEAGTQLLSWIRLGHCSPSPLRIHRHKANFGKASGRSPPGRSWVRAPPTPAPLCADSARRGGSRGGGGGEPGPTNARPARSEASRGPHRLGRPVPTLPRPLSLPCPPPQAQRAGSAYPGPRRQQHQAEEEEKAAAERFHDCHPRGTRSASPHTPPPPRVALAAGRSVPGAPRPAGRGRRRRGREALTGPPSDAGKRWLDPLRPPPAKTADRTAFGRRFGKRWRDRLRPPGHLPPGGRGPGARRRPTQRPRGFVLLPEPLRLCLSPSKTAAWPQGGGSAKSPRHFKPLAGCCWGFFGWFLLWV